MICAYACINIQLQPLCVPLLHACVVVVIRSFHLIQSQTVFLLCGNWFVAIDVVALHATQM